MTMVNALGRIDQIEQTLTQLFEPRQPQVLGGAASAGTGAANADMFAQALAASGLGGTGIGGVGAVAPGAVSEASAIANPGGVTGNSVVAAAEKYLGVPYVFGGTTRSGMDCSGLVQTVFADLGIEVPRVVQDQMHVGQEVPSLAQAMPGDLISLDDVAHIVIYAGNNKIIHAPYEGRTVSLQDVYFDESSIDTIRRVVPATAQPAVSTASAGDLATAARAMLLRGASS